MTTITNALTNLKIAKVNLLVVIGLVVGVAIGYPIGNHTVTKTVTKTNTVTKNVSYQLAIGESEQQALQALKPGGLQTAGTKTVGNQTFTCLVAYGHVDSQKRPTDWYATFCGK